MTSKSNPKSPKAVVLPVLAVLSTESVIFRSDLVVQVPRWWPGWWRWWHSYAAALEPTTSYILQHRSPSDSILVLRIILTHISWNWNWAMWFGCDLRCPCPLQVYLAKLSSLAGSLHWMGPAGTSLCDIRAIRVIRLCWARTPWTCIELARCARPVINLSSSSWNPSSNWRNFTRTDLLIWSHLIIFDRGLVVFINSILCQDPATFISEIGSSTDMTQSIFEAHLLLTAKRHIFFGLDKVHARQLIQGWTVFSRLFTSLCNKCKNFRHLFNPTIVHSLVFFADLQLISSSIHRWGASCRCWTQRHVRAWKALGKPPLVRQLLGRCVCIKISQNISRFWEIRDPFFNFVLHCDLRDLPPLHTITYHYIPLHTITYHYIPLHTITYHYIPLHTITYHYYIQQLPMPRRFLSPPLSGQDLGSDRGLSSWCSNHRPRYEAGGDRQGTASQSWGRWDLKYAWVCV